ncbi:MAG: hypothetical protein K2J74_05145 [Muribaculaceae bacterium]|nr:hypothetical protein [Muribaculaceae bacterium]
MKTTFTFNEEKILMLVKAQAAALALQNPETAHFFIDDHDDLLHVALANGYMNLCGLLLSYLDGVNFDKLDCGEVEIVVDFGNSKSAPLSFLFCAEQYLALYVLKETYSAASFDKAEKVCSENFRSASRRLLELMAL